MKLHKIFGITAALSMLLAACGATPTPAAPTAAPQPTAAPAQPTAVPKPTDAPKATDAPKPTDAPKVAASGMGAEYDQAMTGAYKGKKVTVDGPFSGEDAKKFADTLKDFSDKTGIVIEYVGGKEFEKAISVKVDGGNPPDIADFPQPGLAARFAAQGKVVDLNKVVNMDFVKKNYNQSWLDMATMAGKDGKIMAGVWERVNGKSLVWYPKAAFDKAGYKVPTTWAELVALQDQIKKDGDAPWCVGIESGTATGWAFTDWVEEMMLRTTSPQNYDKWVTNDLKFNSPEVKKAIGEVAAIWFDDKNVYGGRKAIATTGFGDAPTPMFAKPAPKCWLHKQGNFITSFFPKDVKEGVDYDFFYLPGKDAAYGSPVLVAGDLMTMFNDRPEVRALMQAFTSVDHLKGWLKAGGAISPHQDAKADMYGSKVEAKIGEIIQKATAVRFDASDLMPGEVGAGSFWKLGTDYVTGAITIDQMADGIDKSWPAGAATSAATGGAAAVNLGKEYADALTGAYKGKKVTVDGPFSGEDAKKFADTLKDFSDKTGIVIEYVGGKEFEKAISVKVDGGNPPDIADFPQPGLAARFAAQGKVVDLNKVVNMDFVKKNYNQSWLDMATMAGKDGKIMAGVWERVNGKSLVWYPKAAFDKAGYKVPTTWAELVALQDQIKKDGDAPWCVGIESGTATGWAFTDWVEEMMLRTTSPQNYDKWVTNDLKFNSPEVKKAIGEVAAIWFDDKNVYGGRKAIATTGFGDAPTPMFAKPAPKCWLHKQGNFITSFFPKDVKEGVDYDFFYLPGKDAAYGSPVLVAGDLMTMFNDRPEVRALMQAFTSVDHLKGWLKAGGAISPHQDAKADMYGSKVEAKIGEIIQKATAVRFDASDLMPGEVGAGSFWKLGTDYVTGAITIDQMADGIDKSWPKK
ncbi:MAG TPA: ABC transporter substrate-binding protein [Thermoflexales bacterium]|nr:ABC transporter substrate-binding protein [Thermoflexales bacterium]